MHEMEFILVSQSCLLGKLGHGLSRRLNLVAWFMRLQVGKSRE